jgi:predicted Zn-dependent protease
MRLLISLSVLTPLLGCAASGPSWITLRSDDTSCRATRQVQARFGGYCDAPVAEGRIERIAQRLAAHDADLPQTYEAYLLDSDELNAASIPPAKIYLTRGLYERISNEALLAAVVAHELAHLQTRDHFKPPCTTAEERLVRERVADGGAVALLRAGGYQPVAMLHILDLLQATHPSTCTRDRRVALLEEFPLADKGR